MLSPEERALYSECLRAPAGHVLDHAVGLTFSLDLETLLLVPMTLAAFGEAEPDALLDDPIQLLEAIREHAGRVMVFHQRGQVHAPRRHHVLYGLLEEMLVPVQPRHPEAVFHPKLWVLRFVDAAGAPLLRVLVLSRNLTFDRSWDVVLTLDGRPDGHVQRGNTQLADLLRALPDLATSAVESSGRESLDALASELLVTPLEPPPGFEGEPVFHVLGLTADAWRPAARAGRLLVVSPFLSAAPLVYLREHLEEAGWGEPVLVSRQEELDALPPELLGERGWRAHTLVPLVEADAENADLEALPEDPDDAAALVHHARGAPACGLHAKLLAIEAGWGVTWWIGSANTTNAAWDARNVELLVEVSGKKSQVGIDPFLDGGFRETLVGHLRAEPDPQLTDLRAAEQHAEQLRRRLAACDWRLVAHTARATDRGATEAAEPAASWRLELHGACELAVDEGVKLWPVSLPEARALPLEGDRRVFAVDSTASLTALVAFSISVRRGDARVRLGFTLCVPATGFPEDRAAHVVRAIVHDRRGFFRYLQILLQGFDGGLAAMLRSDDDADHAHADLLRAGLDDVLLEDLVRALSRAPERLLAVRRLLRELESTPEGRALVPDAFRALWASLAEVRPELAAAEPGE